MTVITRFAPSPTGHLHVGNLRVAIANALVSKCLEGRFILRYDDTDTDRSSDEFIHSIANDLKWLGIDWDQEVYQSARSKMYKEAADHLRGLGLLYPCYETREELEISRNRMLALGKPPVYNRAAMDLSAKQRREFEDAGRRPHWRFRLEGDFATWVDAVRGEQKLSTDRLSDPILIREDGTFLYTLPSVVDDMSLGITHVIRGEDHVTNTAVQIQLIKALSGDINLIKFAHLPLLTDSSGGPLSKRISSLGIKYFKDNEIEPIVLYSFLAFLGTSSNIKPIYRLDNLYNSFDLKNISRNPPKFNESDLLSLNVKYLRDAPFSLIKNKLGISDVDENFWLVIRENIKTISEVQYWWQVCNGSINSIISESEYLLIASVLLPEGNWDEETFGNWIEKLKNKTGRKGKDLYQPLRLAITGCGDGPELKSLLPFIGYDKTVRRLKGDKV